MTSGPRAGRKKKDAPVHIVLVEDNPGDVYLLERALMGRNIVYELILYQDGPQAMRAISESSFAVPDLILVDLNLPRRDGFDVLSTIRQASQLAGVPVGVFTSSDTLKDRRWAELMGAERYIHKPATLEEFIHQVGDAVEDLLGRGGAQGG